MTQYNSHENEPDPVQQLTDARQNPEVDLLKFMELRSRVARQVAEQSGSLATGHELAEDYESVDADYLRDKLPEGIDPPRDGS
jgi:hypothetical protein